MDLASSDRAFFATAAKGTEPPLRDELRELGFIKVRADRGGVHFRGSLVDGMRACLELRCAQRVLVEVARFESPSEDALYDGVRALDWSAVLTPRHTLAVRAACKSSVLTHTQYIAQHTKDAIVDGFRDRDGARPSVDVGDPDVLIFVHLVRDEATVYLDLGGASLHRRGYRAIAREAPLKETLAAAILRLSGYDRESPFLDPMCGSGTLAIEAALWARRVAPGLALGRLGFERWALFDAGLARGYDQLRERVASRALTSGPPIYASDVDRDALRVAEQNARKAGVNISLERRDVADLTTLRPPGFIVTNPPYGERLQGSPELYASMGRAFRRMRGSVVSVLAGAPSIAHGIDLRPAQAHVLFNGDIECRLLRYEIR